MAVHVRFDGFFPAFGSGAPLAGSESAVSREPCFYVAYYITDTYAFNATPELSGANAKRKSLLQKRSVRLGLTFASS